MILNTVLIVLVTLLSHARDVLKFQGIMSSTQQMNLVRKIWEMGVFYCRLIVHHAEATKIVLLCQRLSANKTYTSKM
ncbi:hypothetical protein ASE93_15415 [Serratia sp. Leaf50]|nr:hypothetical protein ASE93_15415 [Serratia sp. Leaf50]